MELEEQVRSLIIENLKFSGSRADLTSDRNLITSHVIDSMDMLKFISLIEGEFDITIDDTELLPDNFATIGQVAEFVSAKRAEQAQA